MSDFSVDIVQLRNSAFDIGYRLGALIKEKPLFYSYQQLTNDQINVEEMEKWYDAFAPHLIEMLKGMSTSLSISYNQTCAMFSGYDVPKPQAMGCTSYMTNAFYVRNYDFSPDMYDRIFSLIQPPTAYATAGYNLQLLGLHDGVNEKGLVAGLHFVNNDRYEVGIAAWMSIRILLDTCSSVDEAIQLLMRIPHAACYNFSLADSSGNMAVVEATPDVVSVRESNSGYLSCENHFQTEPMTNFNRKNRQSSLSRKNYLDQLAQKSWCGSDLFNHFRDPNSPVFFKEYKELFGTLHTFSYQFDDSRIMTSLANGKNILDFKFDDWVNGKCLKEKELVGKITE